MIPKPCVSCGATDCNHLVRVLAEYEETRARCESCGEPECIGECRG